MHRYFIAYNKTTKIVVVQPDNLAPGPNTFVIGQFLIENPKADVEEYKHDLTETILNALIRVGVTDIGPYEVRLTDFNTGEEQVVKEAEEVKQLEDVPSQHVPVSEDVTIAEAAEMEGQTQESSKKSKTKK